MTAGALRFWQFHAAERQTVVYAISQDHARNLTAVFNDAGIPAAVMLSDTLPHERDDAIKSFGDGTLRVLVNVAVATEGFDLPDASCIVITRPTMSLALYLQMVGRGLRPKSDGGDCLILDLAGNAEIHGLPEDTREWSLRPRGNNPGGDAPVIRCENCDALSPAASHNCVVCDAPFGKDCPRCGRWRATERWSYETRCGEQHELVCDLCHYDAHIQAQLPTTDELRRLTEMETDLDAALRNLLEEERRRAGRRGRRPQERAAFPGIAARESELASDSLLQWFKNHIATLPVKKPVRKMNWKNTGCFPSGKTASSDELAGWKDELDKLEAKVPNGRLIYNNAKERVLQSLEAQAQEAGLLPQKPPHQDAPDRTSAAESINSTQEDMKGWVTFSAVGEWGAKNPNKGAEANPTRFRDSQGNETSVKNWADFLRKISEWLIKEGLLSTDKCPVSIGMRNRYLIHFQHIHSSGREFHNITRLSNGLYLERHLSSKAIARICGPLMTEFGQDPTQFHVLLR